jgi:hypothetical protein
MEDSATKGRSADVRREAESGADSALLPTGARRDRLGSLRRHSARIVTDLYFTALVVLFGSVVVTNSVSLPSRVFHWGMLPLFAVCVLIPRLAGLPMSLLSAGHWLGRSTLLWVTMAYLGLLLLATALRADMPPEEGWTACRSVLWQAIDVGLFVAGTAYLTAIDRGFYRKFFLAAAALLTIYAAINLAEFVLQPLPAGTSSRLSAAFGTAGFGNATHVAPLLVLYAVAALGLAPTSRLTRSEWMLIAFALLFVVPATLLTQARGALLAAATGLILIAAAGSLRWRIALLATLALGATTLWVDVDVRTTLLDRGSSYRPDLWKVYIEMAWQQSRWIGFGLQRELLVTIDQSTFEQPHNTVVWAFLRGGIGAALACAFLLVGSLYWTAIYWRRTGNIAPLAALATLFVTAVTEIGFLPSDTGWLWLMFWLPLGLAAGAELRLKRPHLPMG